MSLLWPRPGKPVLQNTEHGSPSCVISGMKLLVPVGTGGYRRAGTSRCLLIAAAVLTDNEEGAGGDAARPEPGGAQPGHRSCRGQSGRPLSEGAAAGAAGAVCGGGRLGLGSRGTCGAAPGGARGR